MKNVFYYDTKIGKIGIEENGTAITKLYFVIKDLQKEVTRKKKAICIKNIAEIIEQGQFNF